MDGLQIIYSACTNALRHVVKVSRCKLSMLHPRISGLFEKSRNSMASFGSLVAMGIT
jgi:hypothetical protein